MRVDSFIHLIVDDNWSGINVVVSIPNFPWKVMMFSSYNGTDRYHNNGRTLLHVIPLGTMNSNRYINEDLLPHNCLFRGAFDDTFRFIATSGCVIAQPLFRTYIPLRMFGSMSCCSIIVSNKQGHLHSCSKIWMGTLSWIML